MHTDHLSSHPAAQRGCTRLVVRLLLPALLSLGWLGSAAPSLADGCSGCPAPTDEQIKAAAGDAYKALRGENGSGYPDTIYKDAGECESAMVDVPEIRIIRQWLELRGTGEVWNCPHSKSEDTITVRTEKADSTQWSLVTTTKAGLKSLVAKIESSITAGKRKGETVTEVTEISKKITPSFCHRIKWNAWFTLAEIEAEAEFKFRQRWRWWTKNRSTGWTHVHASGDIYVDCGTATVTLGRQAPIAGYFELSQRGCDDAECGHVVEKKLGFFPPLPPGLPPPGGEEPGSEGEEPGGPSSGEAPASGSELPSSDELPDAPAEEEEEYEPTKPDSSSELPDPPAGSGEAPTDDPGQETT